MRPFRRRGSISQQGDDPGRPSCLPPATSNSWAAFGARPYGAFPPVTPNSAFALKEVVHGAALFAALVAILFSVLVVILFIPEHLLD